MTERRDMTALTPREIVAELDKHIVGQADAKRAVAVAVRNRWRRQQLAADLARDVYPKNLLMIGPTGVGKTEIARRLATLTGAPFVKVEATKFTEVGYHGRDVDAMIRDLVEAAIATVKAEQTERVKQQAEASVEERLLDLLLPPPNPYGVGASVPTSDEPEDSASRTRERFRERLRSGAMEDQLVEVTTEQKPDVMNMLGPAGLELGPDMQSMFERMMPSRRDAKRLPIREARRVMLEQEAERMVDMGQLTRLAVERAEQAGIVFIDEIDKVASSGKSDGPDVSRQGVQRDLLPLVEGSTVTTKHGPVRTDHVLFIAAGAFHDADPGDLMPELQGRFPIRVELQPLEKADLARILREPRHSLLGQQAALLAVEGMTVTYTDDAIEAMADVAHAVNQRTQNLGARRLHTILERVFEDVSFDASDRPDRSLTIDGKYVYQRLADVMKDAGVKRRV